MPSMHQAVFSEEFPTGPFQGRSIFLCFDSESRFKELGKCLKSVNSALEFSTLTIFLYLIISVPQSHRTSTLKKELASSRSRPSVKSESSDGEGWMDEHKEVTVKTERMKTPSGWNCAPCHVRYTDREGYITHMAKQHGKVWRSNIPLTIVPKI